MKHKYQLLSFGLFFVLAFVAFLFPIFNPDLFWHLASARKAEELGRLFLSWETFSFTKYGSFWINYEWLFEKIVWAIYQLGDFRLLAIFRASLLVLILFSFDQYAKRFFQSVLKPHALMPSYPHTLRFINLVFAYYFLHTRATMQPELFSLLFLIFFFFLRDFFLKPPLGPLARRPLGLLVLYYLLFVLWSNIHGGFVWFMAILGLQVGAAAIGLANLYYRKLVYKESLDHSQLSNQNLKLKTLSALLFLSFSATLINPYGFAVYKLIFLVVKDTPFAAVIIDEWRTTQFYHQGTWLFWIVALVSIVLAVVLSFKERRFLFEEMAILLGMGWFTAAHIRNLALFGIVCLPIFWRLLESWLVPVYPRLEGKTRIRRFLLLTPRFLFLILLFFMVFFAGKKLVSQSWDIGRMIYLSRGLPKRHIAGGSYPDLAVKFLEKNPKLLSLKTFAEWGWGGYIIWRLHEKGMRLFFDGRYIFLDLLRLTSLVTENPENWESYTKTMGIDMIMTRYPGDFKSIYTPKLKGEGRDLAFRSWQAMAISREDWALVWWDHVSLVFVRRSKMPKEWIEAHEYKSRYPIDPFWVAWLVKKKEMKPDSLFEEFKRNKKEVGLNFKNYNLLMNVKNWRRKN